MRSYSLVLLLKPDLKKEKKEKVLKDVKNLLGKVEEEKTESIGEKKLAYNIKKNQKGDYVLVNFKTDGLDNELNKKITIQEDILRHLLIRGK